MAIITRKSAIEDANTIEYFFKEWYEAFAFNVPEKIMNQYVLENGNLPWHIFTWGEVDAIEGEDAKKRLIDQHFDSVMVLCGYPDDFLKIKIVKSKRRLKKLLKYDGDLYITSMDFSWTFVKTHEISFGPYFKIRERNTLISYK